MANDTQQCPGCNTDYPKENFYYDRPDGPRRQRAGFKCWKCRIADEVRSETYDGWDWAKALLKSTRMSLYHDEGKNKDRARDHTTSLSPADIRALMQFQHGRCALTSHIRLVYPEREGSLPKNMTFACWAKTIPEDQQQCTPVLVRAVKAQEWMAGNIMLIARVYYPLYEFYDTLADIGYAFNRTPALQVPTLQTVNEIKHQIMMRMEHVWNEETKRRIEAYSTAAAVS
jgi:hypothetical protein